MQQINESQLEHTENWKRALQALSDIYKIWDSEINQNQGGKNGKSKRPGQTQMSY